MPALFALLLLTTLPPFIAQASGSVVGSFTMFARVERYHIGLEVVTAGGARAVKLASLAPHLHPRDVGWRVAGGLPATAQKRNSHSL